MFDFFLFLVKDLVTANRTRKVHQTAHQTLVILFSAFAMSDDLLEHISHKILHTGLTNILVSF